MIGRRAFLGLACFVAAAILSGCQTLPREARRWQGRFSLVAHSAAQKGFLQGNGVVQKLLVG